MLLLVWYSDAFTTYVWIEAFFKSDKIYPKSVSNITAAKRKEGAFKICIFTSQKEYYRGRKESFPRCHFTACNFELGWLASVYFMSISFSTWKWQPRFCLFGHIFFFLAWLLLIRVDCWLLNHLWGFTTQALQVPISFEKSLLLWTMATTRWVWNVIPQN